MNTQTECIVNKMPQHLYDIFIGICLRCIRVILDEVYVSVAKDNIHVLKATITVRVKETRVGNVLQFKVHLSREMEIERFYVVKVFF